MKLSKAQLNQIRKYNKRLSDLVIRFKYNEGLVLWVEDIYTKEKVCWHPLIKHPLYVDYSVSNPNYAIRCLFDEAREIRDANKTG